MNVMRSLNTPDRAAARDEPRPRPFRRPDEAHRTGPEELPGGLRVERLAAGTRVIGPKLTVWDADHAAAVSWARQLSRAEPTGEGAADPPQRGAEWTKPQTRLRPAAAEPRMPHVLLAEDDADFRALLAQAFHSRGCQVTACVDGPDLVAKLASYVIFGRPTRFDLVVSDIRMPGATALEVLEAMRECRGVPPVILITAFPSEDTEAHARQLGVATVFAKPFEIEDLVTKAEDLLAERPGDAP